MSTWRVVAGLVGLCLLQSVYAAEWQKISAQVTFSANGSALGRLLIYQGSRLSETDDSAFKTMAAPLRTALLSPQTTNPFRARFPAIYRERSALAHCPMLAAAIDVDNQASTQEYLIAYSRLRCLELEPSERLRHGDTEPHYVILQQQANDRYRVLMESDGEISVLNKQAAGYKALESKVMLEREFPTHELQCGGAELTWRYDGNAYQLSKTSYVAQDCEPRHFPNLAGAEWDKAYAQVVRKVQNTLAPVIRRFD